MPNPRELARQDVWTHSTRMWKEGLVVASAGNVSCRIDGEEAIAITPTTIPYGVMTVDQIAIVGSDGTLLDAPCRPSGELPLHLGLYRALPDVRAIVHTHSPFVTSLSILRRPLAPYIDEMMFWFGGTVEVAEYSFTGTARLADNVLRALGDRSAVMLSNHGNVCVGATADEALHVAIVMESAARAYVQALMVGEPVPLPEEAVNAGRAMYEKRKMKK